MHLKAELFISRCLDVVLSSSCTNKTSSVHCGRGFHARIHYRRRLGWAGACTRHDASCRGLGICNSSHRASSHAHHSGAAPTPVQKFCSVAPLTVCMFECGSEEHVWGGCGHAGAIAITHMLNANVWCTPNAWSTMIITSGTKSCYFHPVLLPLLCVCVCVCRDYM